MSSLVEQKTETPETVDLFDLDLRVGVGNVSAGPAVTSYSYCTPGCTSDGGGSGCSHCC
ncbi:gallidermin/nisin family lantibiotic [Amycolatopsis sp. NPDC059021]|uniref:gallidermin/nisin family lantibiotic n=1 Tax=Amycolatopsis sp. NPDC059021 TaxID=3346704 RepID=UPI003672581B